LIQSKQIVMQFSCQRCWHKTTSRDHNSSKLFGWQYCQDFRILLQTQTSWTCWKLHLHSQTVSWQTAASLHSNSEHCPFTT